MRPNQEARGHRPPHAPRVEPADRLPEEVAAWRPRTLRDELAERRARGERRRAGYERWRDGVYIPFAPEHEWPQEEIDPEAPVRCEGLPGRRCGRPTQPEMFRDVSGLPEALRRRADGSLVDFCCDACEQLLYDLELTDPIEVAQLRGAPPAVLAWIERQLTRDPYAPGHRRALERLAAARGTSPAHGAGVDGGGAEP